MEDLAATASKDVANFLDEYTVLLQHLGGDDMVAQMHREVRFRVKMGAELAEALADHYNHMKIQYRF